MGIPLPPPPNGLAGLDCPACTPSPFPEGSTPAFVHAVFRDIVTLPGNPDPPLDFPIEIPQDPLNPCRWFGDFEYNGATWTINYYANTSLVTLYSIDAPNGLYFTGTLSPCSSGPYTNETISPPDAGSGGTAYVLDLPVYYVMLLAYDYNLQPDPTTLYELSDSADPDHVVVRLTGRQQSGSVLIDLDTTAIPP